MQTAEKQQRLRDRPQTEIGAVVRVKDNENYAAAVRRLDELSAELKVHIDKKARMESFIGRYSEDARPYLRTAPKMWDLQASHIEVLSKLLIHTGKMPADVFRPSELAAKFRDPDAKETIQEFDVARRAIEVLKSAVEIQRKTVAAAKQEAIAQISRSLWPKYEPIARRFAIAILELDGAIADHREFNRRFISEDPELPQALKLTPPFLEGVLSNPNLIAWIEEAKAAGLAEPMDPRATASKATKST